LKVPGGRRGRNDACESSDRVSPTGRAEPVR
jgi:hypothetical protein